jgi:hypothetical protein
LDKLKTQVTEVFPKTIINVCPDLPMDYSMNPYQGCEHGCSIVLRDRHEFWATAQALILKEN